MRLLETLKDKLGWPQTTQPIDADFANRLQAGKERRAAQSTEEFNQAAIRQQQEQLARAQQLKEDKETSRRLSEQANKLFRSRLEAIKKVYGNGKGDIVLAISKDSHDRSVGVFLTLIWNRSIVHHDATISSGRASSSHPAYNEKIWNEAYFFVDADGLGEFGNRYCSQNDRYGYNSRRFYPQPVKFNSGVSNWQNELAEKIPEIIQR